MHCILYPVLWNENKRTMKSLFNPGTQIELFCLTVCFLQISQKVWPGFPVNDLCEHCTGFIPLVHMPVQREWAAPSGQWGYPFRSPCPFVCTSVWKLWPCLSVVACNLWCLQGAVLVLGVPCFWVKHFQLTSCLMCTSLWPWPWMTLSGVMVFANTQFVITFVLDSEFCTAYFFS